MLPQDQQKLISCLVAAIPLSYILSCIRKPTYTLLFSCTVSIFMQVIVFQQWIVILWLQQNIVYLLCKFGNRNNIGKIVTIQTFILLCIIQILRMYLSYGVQNVDITAIFMMQVFQYISFSYNYQDGGSKDGQKNEYVINRLPPYAEYLGYVMFIPSCLVGPVFQFKDYQHYLYKTGIYKNIKPGYTPPAMLKQLKTTILTLAAYFILMPFPLSFMLTSDYTEYSYLMQIFYLIVSITGARFKYYAAWSLGMVAVHATGLTNNPKIDQFGHLSNNWDRIVVSNIWDFQMQPSMKKKADGWNIPVQVALKRYVYDRTNKPTENMTHKQKKRLQIQAQQKTLAVSALWHGLYPGYFLAFFHWGLLLQVSQELHRIQRNSSKLKKFRHQFKYIELFIINYFLGYFGVCFQFMTWQKIKVFFAASYYVPIIIVYIANIVVVRLGLFSKNVAKHRGEAKKLQQQNQDGKQTKKE